jgi:hypothetical protein
MPAMRGAFSNRHRPRYFHAAGTAGPHCLLDSPPLMAAVALGTKVTTMERRRTRINVRRFSAHARRQHAALDPQRRC